MSTRYFRPLAARSIYPSLGFKTDTNCNDLLVNEPENATHSRADRPFRTRYVALEQSFPATSAEEEGRREHSRANRTSIP